MSVTVKFTAQYALLDALDAVGNRLGQLGSFCQTTTMRCCERDNQLDFEFCGSSKRPSKQKYQ